MARNNTHEKDAHIDDLWLAYQEGLLDDQEQAEVEAHLSKCSHCTAELEERRRWAKVLEIHKEVFCLGSCLASDQAQHIEKTQNALPWNLESCESFSELGRALEEGEAAAAISDELLNGLQRISHQRSSPTIGKRVKEWLSDLTDRTSDLFRAPLLATAGVLAAAILLVLFTAPLHPVDPVVALSPVTWGDSFLRDRLMGVAESTPAPERSSAIKERLAIVILLAGFKRPMPQEKIDTLYDGMRPPDEMGGRLEILTPHALKTAVDSGRVSTETKERLIEGLSAELGTYRAALLTVRSQGDRFAIAGELIDTLNGKVLRKTIMKDVSDNELLLKLEQVALAVTDSDWKNRSE